MEPIAPSIDDVIKLVAAVGLPGAPIDDPVGVSVPDGMWPHVIEVLARRRMTGLAVAAARDGVLRLTEVQRDQLGQRQGAAMGLVLVLEQTLRDLSSAMRRLAIPTIVLKGPATANTYYRDPSWRTYGDLDILAPTGSWGSMLDLLSDMGFARLVPEPRKGFDERFGKGAAHEDPHGLQIDLHRTLALGPFGLWIDTRSLIEGTIEFPLKGMELRRLDETNTLIHACIHAALGQQEPLIMPLRDVLQVAWSGRIDWNLAEARVRAWRLAAPVRHALRIASSRLALPLPDEAEQLLRIEVPWVERHALKAYTTDRRNRAGMSLASLWAIDGISQRSAYVLAMLFPARRFLAAPAREGSASRLGRLMTPIQWAHDRIPGRRRSRRRWAARGGVAPSTGSVDRVGDDAGE